MVLARLQSLQRDVGNEHVNECVFILSEDAQDVRHRLTILDRHTNIRRQPLKAGDFTGGRDPVEGSASTDDWIVGRLPNPDPRITRGIRELVDNLLRCGHAR